MFGYNNLFSVYLSVSLEVAGDLEGSVGASTLFQNCRARRRVSLSSRKAGLVGFCPTPLLKAPLPLPHFCPGEAGGELGKWQMHGPLLNTAVFRGPWCYTLEVRLLELQAKGR